MKKIALVLAVCFLSATSFAQFSVGLHGTGSLSDAHVKTLDDLSYKKQMKAMPGGGIVLQFAINKNWAIRTGLNYAQNGLKLNGVLEGDAHAHIKLENNLHYAQVPLNLVFTLPVSRIQFYAGGGGYISYGISGKVRSTVDYTTAGGQPAVMVQNHDAFKKEEDGGAGFKKTDYGVGALAGIRFGKVFVHAGYQLSLANISTGEDKEVYKNRSLQLTIGYFLR